MLDNPKQGSPTRAPVAALWAAAIAAVVGFAAVYVTFGRSDNAVRPAAETTSTVATVKQLTAPSGPGSNALSQGHMAAFVFKKEPEAVPEVRFQDGNGAEKTLADWRGKVVLVNLWATWCAPCRKEMPALDHLQKELGSSKFEVVAISIDRTGLPGARKFLDETGVKDLALYADPTTKLSSVLRAVGLPVTVLIDAQGREIGRLVGPAEWDSEDAKRLIRAVMQ
ncbi:MAG TPA: TlpA disulfide reductase family protein [Hyphomicrobiaceae bacterium]|jgi:thiol-disulfide isomerase/thioredoxin|nr:TlpA disulfide reductase family protein [Hyphomicrobiaceae bacterium]